MQRGQTALIDIDALPGRRYAAQIQAIDPLIDANGRSVGVRACIDNRQLQLRPGMFARVNAVFDVRENARVIPEEAIVPQGGKQYVIKLLDDPTAEGKPLTGSKITQRVEVKLGLRSPGRVEILEGLLAGETIMTSGQQRVQKDGTRVMVVAASGAARPFAGASAAMAPVATAALAGPNPCGTLAAPGALTSPRSTRPAALPPASSARNLA